MPQREKVMVVLSGGQDSTTCLYWAKQNYKEVHAITFDYNQRHRREIASAIDIALRAKVESHQVVSLEGVLQGTSPLVSNNELEQYKDHASLPEGLEKTFVPMRNQLFFTVAANRAFCLGINTLVAGVCQADFGGYPDCRRAFVNKLQDASTLGTFNRLAGIEALSIKTPLMYLTKAQSVALALTLPGCYKALAYSHTSYAGEWPPKSQDHASLLRERGFLEAMVPDPLILRAVMQNLMPLPATPNYANDVIEPFMQLILQK